MPQGLAFLAVSSVIANMGVSSWLGVSLLKRGVGAGRGSRIPTVSLPADFESAASTSSAIPAWGAGHASAARCPAEVKTALSRKPAVAHSAARNLLRPTRNVRLFSRLLDERCTQRTVRDVRPAAARLPVLLRASTRCARGDGPDARYVDRARMRERLFDWLATLRRRTTVTDALVETRTDAHRAHGVHIGIW